jgi:hypothetical protein
MNRCAYLLAKQQQAGVDWVSTDPKGVSDYMCWFLCLPAMKAAKQQRQAAADWETMLQLHPTTIYCVVTGSWQGGGAAMLCQIAAR